MKQKQWLRCVAVCGLAASLLFAANRGVAQENGQWRAASTTAKGVTGDIAFAGQKIAINFSAFTVAQIRELTPAETAALFPSDSPTAATPGNLYRTSIPAEKRFLHKNTLCGSDETQWIASSVNGRTLRLAFFSGPKMPVFTPESVADPTALCGIYSYVR